MPGDHRSTRCLLEMEGVGIALHPWGCSPRTCTVPGTVPAAGQIPTASQAPFLEHATRPTCARAHRPWGASPWRTPSAPPSGAPTCAWRHAPDLCAGDTAPSTQLQPLAFTRGMHSSTSEHDSEIGGKNGPAPRILCVLARSRRPTPVGCRALGAPSPRNHKARRYNAPCMQCTKYPQASRAT